MGFIHLALHQEESQLSAEATECAAEQDAFWEYHDILFERFGQIINKENLQQYAVEIGLDTNAFNTCLDSGRYSELIATQMQLAGIIGIRGTPTFLINDVGVSGAQPFEVFQQIIENELQ